YLQSNVMPILDEQSSKTQPPPQYTCQKLYENPYAYCPSTGWYYSSLQSCASQCDHCDEIAGGVDGYVCRGTGRMFSYDINRIPDEPNNAQDCAASCFASMEGKSYPPLAICNDMGGDGGVVHVIGNSSMLDASAGNYGTVLPSSLDYETRTYLGLSGDNSVSLAGSAAIMVRASFLKQDCSTPPLAGIEIMPYEDAKSLIGTGDLSNKSNPARGSLHKFFYSTSQQAQQGFEYHTAKGMVDKVPDSVDMLLLDWYPMCSGQGKLPGENETYEFDSKLEFARAMMANFSKPMLVWKFAFPQDTKCNATIFLDYMFNNTAAMVDSGMIGVIYSDWMMADGLGYGPVSRSYNDNHLYGNDQHNWPDGSLLTGLTQSPPAVRGFTTPTLTLDNPRSMSDIKSGKGALFCAVQLFSKRAIGYIPLSYGQKLYADNQTCDCQECSNYDYITGACDLSAKLSTDQGLAQLYCNDGTTCLMPSGRSDTGGFRCADRCMNATACRLCSDPSHSVDSSFCRITPAGGRTFGNSKCYSSITDDNWDYIAGLSPSEKCCLQSNATDTSDAKYTYTLMTGSKQQAEFLQFPAHGEQNIDCGRSPDTSVLTYCNIRVPISQEEIACMKVRDPQCPANPQSQTYVD
ncbi:MAG: hypothetical protein NTX79_02035, partial [Candidatus Micrarchaeota archaeon]|nr:hypothetical protein [Candidatus Micrarchaeota archaeon]